jgi:hypothetical protein
MSLSLTPISQHFYSKAGNRPTDFGLNNTAMRKFEAQYCRLGGLILGVEMM